MRHNGLILFLFALFLFEGTVMHWLIPAAWQTEVKVAPQPVLVVIAMIGLYLHRYWGLAYGVGFGLLHDIVYYGPMIGTYTAAYGIVGYLSGMAANLLRGNILTSMFIVVSGNLLFEWIVYGIYTVFQITHVNVYWVFCVRCCRAC